MDAPEHDDHHGDIDPDDAFDAMDEFDPEPDWAAIERLDRAFRYSSAPAEVILHEAHGGDVQFR